MLRFSVLATLGLAIFLTATHRMDAGGKAPVKVFNLEKLNTDGDDEDPCPTPDGNTLYFARKGKKHYDIFLARRSTAGFAQSKPFIFNRDADARCPFWHQNKFYYVTNEVPDKKLADLKNFDLRWQTGTQAPLYVPGDVNSRDEEMYPWVTPGGREFYFSRKTRDGWKLFVANGPVPGPIGKSKEVGFPAGFHRATMSGACLTMYLEGPLEDGRTGIFRAKRTKAGAAWSKPEPLKMLNHSDAKRGDMQPAISFDGARLYFASDRPGTKGGLDLWYVGTAALK